MSPEQIKEEKYNHKSDIWSLGCIIYETAALRPPFQADNYLSLAMKIKEGTISSIPENYSKDLQNVIECMLQLDQEKRPSVNDLLNLPQVSKIVSELKFKETYRKLRQREKDVEKREQLVSQKEKILEEKLKQIEEREKAVTELESRYNVIVRNQILII